MKPVEYHLFRRSILACGLGLSVVGSSPSAFAAQQTWDGAASGVWDLSAINWAGAAFTSTNDALFTGTPTNNVTSATGLTIGAITLDNTFTGTVAMTGNNTVSGATTISGGILSVLHTGTATGTVTATDLGTSAITVNSGGTFSVDDTGNGTTGAERILALGNTISGSGIINAKASALHTNGWSSINFTGDLSGFTGTLNIVTPSTANRAKVKFTASQSTLLSSSATVNVQNGAQLYLTQALNYGFAIKLNGGTGGEGNGSLRLDNASLNVTGAVTLQADSIISGAGTISGGIGQSGGTYRLTKVGNNTTVLTGANTYTGGTTISVGTLQLGNGTTDGSIANAGNVTNNATLNFNNINPLTYTGNITGAGGILTKTGAGTLTLGGTSSVNTLNVNNATGTVDLGSGGSLTINNGGGNTIQSSTGGTISGGTITLGATDGDTGTASGTTLTINSKITSGAGVRLEYWNGNVANTGTLVLTNAANDYTGGTAINTAGTISVSTINNTGAAGNLGTGGTISLATNAATLKYTGAGETTNRTITMSGGANTGGTIDASGTGTALRLSNVTNTNTANGTATLTLTGTGLGEITGSLANQSSTRLTAVTKAGAGTWRLSGSNSIGSNMNVTAGSLEITGTTNIDGGAAANLGFFNASGNTSVTVLSGGSLSVLGTTNATKPGSIIGQNATGTTTLTVNGGSLTIGGQTGFALGNNRADATGVLTVSSGTATITAGSTTASDSRSYMALGRDGATGTINLNGGTLESSRNFVRDGSSGTGVGDTGGVANFNFGGGTLKALASQSDWLNSSTKPNNQLALTSVTTTSATSTIDANGFAVGINNAISGAGGFHIIDSSVGGGGVVTFGGAKTYNGATAIDSGTLLLNGSITSSVTVNNTGKLGGSGTITGDLTVKSGGTHAVGNSPGLQTVSGNATYESGSIFSWDLAANLDGDLSDGGDTGTRGTNYDAVNVGGNLSVDSGAVFRVIQNGGLDFNDNFWDSAQVWNDIFSVTGTTTSNWLNTVVSVYDTVGGPVDVSAYGGFTITGTSLSWSAVPEPTTAMAGLLLGAGLLRRKRRKG